MTLYILLIGHCVECVSDAGGRAGIRIEGEDGKRGCGCGEIVSVVQCCAVQTSKSDGKQSG